MDYPYIRAWCRLMGSYQYYTESQVDLARMHKAPADAIFYSETERRWHRWSEMKDTNPNKHTVAAYVAEMRLT